MRFAVGQPLGYYSSWPLFALSHHTIVWLAAEQVYPGKVFDRYAILGDDVVIADNAVASVYKTFLQKLSVEISEAKSIVSPSGCAEFAKRFLLKRATVDVSPISVKKVSMTFSVPGWYHFVTTHEIPLRYSTMLRIGGIGHKAASRPPASRKHKRVCRRMWCLYVHSFSKRLSFYITLSVITGVWLDPTVVGQIWHYLYGIQKI